MDENQFDNITSKLISLNWPTVNPYAGLQVAGLVIRYFCFCEMGVYKLTLQWERFTKICLKQRNKTETY